MPKLRQMFAVVCLLTLWLGATQHCNLEAAGVLEHTEAGDSCCPNPKTATDCHADGCKIVESASYRSFGPGKLVSVPVITCSAWVICVSLTVPEPDDSLTFASRPGPDDNPPWVPAWSFVRRAAAVPGAPSLLLAA